MLYSPFDHGVMCIASLRAIAPKYRDYFIWDNCLACRGHFSTFPFLPRALGIPFDSCSSQWRSTTSFANSLHSSILRTDTHCGSQARGNRTGLWKSAMLVSYAMADFIVFSMHCVLQKDNPTCQSIMNNFRPSFQIISAGVFLVPSITVLPESPWSLNLNSMPLGNYDSLSRCLITVIVTAQTTFGRFRSSAQIGEEVQYYLSQ